MKLSATFRWISYRYVMLMTISSSKRVY